MNLVIYDENPIPRKSPRTKKDIPKNVEIIVAIDKHTEKKKVSPKVKTAIFEKIMFPGSEFLLASTGRNLGLNSLVHSQQILKIGERSLHVRLDRQLPHHAH